jgi:hypothetical protein
VDVFDVRVSKNTNKTNILHFFCHFGSDYCRFESCRARQILLGFSRFLSPQRLAKSASCTKSSNRRFETLHFGAAANVVHATRRNNGGKKEQDKTTVNPT